MPAGIMSRIRSLLRFLFPFLVATSSALAQGEPEIRHILKEWEITGPIPGEQIDLREIDYPNFFTLNSLQWRAVTAEMSGLVDISRHFEESGRGPVVFVARTTLKSDSLQQVRLTFGHSDEIAIYVNKTKIFCGDSAGPQADTSTPWAASPDGHIYVYLNRGLNEILLLIKESPGYDNFLYDFLPYSAQ